MSFTLAINGQNRSFDNLNPPVSLEQVIAEMALKGDRIAVEHNGEIVQRARWSDTAVSSGDRLEVVHFVGGGACDLPERPAMPGRVG
jgi:sulfur carrier protein